jgi:hypothetical protein
VPDISVHAAKLSRLMACSKDKPENAVNKLPGRCDRVPSNFDYNAFKQKEDAAVCR